MATIPAGPSSCLFNLNKSGTIGAFFELLCFTEFSLRFAKPVGSSKNVKAITKIAMRANPRFRFISLILLEAAHLYGVNGLKCSLQPR
jgi:hypothetical protein